MEDLPEAERVSVNLSNGGIIWEVNGRVHGWADTSGRHRKERNTFLADLKDVWIEDSRNGIIFKWIKRTINHETRFKEALGRLEKVRLFHLLLFI